MNKESIVLYVGCGMGRAMKFATPYCKEIHGVDTSTLALRRELKIVFFIEPTSRRKIF